MQSKPEYPPHVTPIFTLGSLYFFASLSAMAAPNLEFEGIRHLDLRVASGDVKVKGVDGAQAKLTVVKKRYDERCRLVVEQRNDTLFVELAPKGLFQARCEADFEFQLPKAVAMKFRNGSGDTEVRGMSGEFEAESGSGDIHAEGLRAPATVRTGSGDVRLKFETVPLEGAVEIRSGSGDAEVLFPQKSKIRTSFRAGSGTLKNTLGESHDARFSVNMKSGSGDLTVGRL